MSDKDYRFFLGGLLPEGTTVSDIEGTKVNQGSTPTLVHDGLSMDERWALDPIQYVQYMSAKLVHLNKITG